MIEISPMVIIFLAEACAVLLLALLVVIGLQIRTRRRQQKAVAQLVAQIKQQSKTRLEASGFFLQGIYQLNEAALKSAVQTIDAQERKFFQKIINLYLGNDVDLIASMDASVAELIDTYKSLKPAKSESQDSEVSGDSLAQLQALQLKNKKLTEELAVTKKKMTDMIEEFSNMFGGGKSQDPATPVAADEADKAAE